MVRISPCHSSLYRLCISLFIFVWWFEFDAVVNGQTPPTQPTALAAETAKPAVPVDPPKPDLRFSIGWVSTVGSYTYVPEKWGELHINLLNSRDTPRELLCVSSFDEQPQIQFGRRVWLPARTKIKITHPILIPKCDSVEGRGMNLHSLIFEDPSSDSALIKNETGQMLQDGVILVTRETRTTALIGTQHEEEIAPQEIIDLIASSRACHDLTSKITFFLEAFLPADETSLNGFEHLVITDNRVTDDLAALSAIRHWLNAGGRLWVMLDRVDPQVLEGLLGDDFKGHLVDRVGLTSVRVDLPPMAEGTAETIGDVVEYDDPVQLARVVVQDFDVLSTVNGWPAAFTRRCGDGVLLVTTLGPRGWIKRSDDSSQNHRNPHVYRNHVTLTPMRNIATDFFGPRETELLPKAPTEQLVREYVGYTVPSWMLIVGTLFGFSVSLVAVGIVLWKAGRLEHFGWIGAVVAVVVSVFLLSVGRSFRHSVSETVASIQLAQALAGTDDVRTQGVIATYHPEGSKFGIRTNHAGRLWPDMQGTETSTRRMVSTDFGAWHWDNLNQPAGLRVTSFEKSETIPDRIEAQMTFDERGAVGRYSGRLPAGTDAMVGTRNGRIGVTFHSDGSFAAPADDVFDKDQYLKANLLGDEQNRRRRSLMSLFDNSKRRDFPDRPQLFFWTDRWQHGFEFGENIKPQNSALVAVPLVFHRPANGTEIVIPPPFLPYVNRVAPDGTPPSTMWNNRRNEWQERADPGTTWLSFQIPKELLPLTPRRARVAIDVSGPVGLIELSGLKNGAAVTLKTVMDPVGSISVEIDDPDVLSIDANGHLSLGLSAGDPKRPELTRTNSPPPSSPVPSSDGKQKRTIDLNAKVNYWRIDSLKLQLWAKTDEPPVKE